MSGPSNTLASPWPASRLDAAVGTISEQDYRSILSLLLGHPSPTGSEIDLAEAIATWCRSQGIRADVDRGSGNSASVVLTVSGARPDTAPTMLIYAPIDTLAGEDPSRHAPWFGEADALRRSSAPRRADGWVGGEGAENPKGYAASALLAALCLSRPGHAPPGDVRVALCGGSVPSLGGGDASTLGFGSGLLRLLQRGLTADYAVTCKPGWRVAHEEVGLVWLRLLLAGRGAYVGFRHITPYRNPIPVAGRLAEALEDWFQGYAADETSGFVAPQGAVAGMRAGIAELSAFVGEACELRIDMRVSPRRTLPGAVRMVRDAIARFLADEDGIRWRLETVAAVPPSHTPERSAVVVAARSAWEAIEGGPHPRRAATSGASDTCLLRAWGIPAARVGMPLDVPPAALGDDAFCMNAVDPRAGVRLSELLVRTVIGCGGGGVDGHA